MLDISKAISLELTLGSNSAQSIYTSTDKLSNTNRGNEMAKVSQLSSYQSAWLKAEDLQGQPRKVSISEVKVEMLPQQDGSKQEKIIVSFYGKQKKLILNKSQATALVTGVSDDTDLWVGRELILSPSVNNNGGATIAVAVVPMITEQAEGAALF